MLRVGDRFLLHVNGKKGKLKKLHSHLQAMLTQAHSHLSVAYLTKLPVTEAL
jgi:hypothetical protein